MRVALVSDIHGNLVSLDAVLTDIARQKVDQIICLGDVVALGPQPREVLARLKALGCACVMGNHDLDVLNPDVNCEPGAWITEVTAWCAALLPKADLDFLRSFRPMIEIPLDARVSMLCYHGSPRSSADRILSTTPAEELDEMLAGHTALVMAGGHNHVQMLRQHKEKLIVDVGSVGAPLEQIPFEKMPRFLPWAEYAVGNWVDDVLSIDFRRVSIDLDAVKGAALVSNMPGTDQFVSWWITPEES